MDTGLRCGAIAAGLFLSLTTSDAALAPKSKATLKVAPAETAVAALSFDALSSTSWSASGLALSLPPPPAAGPLPLHVQPHTAFFVDATPDGGVFSATAIGPMPQERAERGDGQEPFSGSEPATYSLVLAGIGLIVTIARRRM